MASQCVADLPGVGENLDRPSRSADRRHGERPPTAITGRASAGACCCNGLQFKLFGTGPITSAGVEAGAFVNPVDPDAEPTIQAFCVPIVYLDRDTRDLVEDTYGLTVTTVVVKPKSRGFVRLRSANPADMPLVSPHLLKHPDDVRAMIEGQRFFLRAFQTSPLKERIRRVGIPDPADLSDEALAKHCKRMVKTNYHPCGTCRMGPPGDAAGGARIRGCACAAWSGCGSATSRPCPTSMRETPTPRR